MAVVGADALDAERELVDDVIDEVDGIDLVVAAVDLQSPDAGGIIDRRVLVALDHAALYPFEDQELDVHLDVMAWDLLDDPDGTEVVLLPGGAFGNNIDHGMLVKLYGEKPGIGLERKYSPGECVGARKETIAGNPEKRHISTSHVERSNLTMRRGSLASPTHSRTRSTTTFTRCRSTSSGTISAGLTRRTSCPQRWRLASVVACCRWKISLPWWRRGRPGRGSGGRTRNRS